MKILVDLNVFMDVIHARKDFVAESRKILSLVERGKHQGCFASHTATTAYYLTDNQGGKAIAESAIGYLLDHFEIVPIGKDELQKARLLSFKDFEDAVVATAAVKAKCKYIITRNTRDFAASPIPALTPAEFLAL